MSRFLLSLAAAFGWAAAAPAAVVVFANFTPADLTFTVTEKDQKPQTVTLAPAQVGPVRVTGPAVVEYPAAPANGRHRLDPYHAYVFLPDEKAGRRLEGIELPGDAPERDARPELNPAPPEPVKIAVTLLVDDADPRADRLWQATVRTRFDAAATVIGANAGVTLEFDGFATWKSDPSAKSVADLLKDFEGKYEVKPGRLAIGYTSRKLEDRPKEQPDFGDSRPSPANYLLMREWSPKSEVEKVEVLIHHLGRALGATLSPDEGSVMREKVANGLALVPQYRLRFDPLNVLAMNIWADELRRGGVTTAGDVSPVNRVRLARVYKALLKARPGDSLAQTYLNKFDRDLAKLPDPKKEPADPKPADPPAKKEPPKDEAARGEVARAVVRAVAARGRANAGPGALAGDDLTAAYVKAAAAAALAADGPAADAPERLSGFLLGLAVALDDADTLKNDPLAAEVVAGIESAADAEARVAVLGNPTIRGRRDWCRRFAVGCGTGDILTPNRAEDAAVNRALSPAAAQRPAGVSLTGLAAELGGNAFAKSLRDEPGSLRKLAEAFAPADALPPTAGLRDGLSPERFEADYGGVGDDRFRAALADIRARAKKLPGR